MQACRSGSFTAPDKHTNTNTHVSGFAERIYDTQVPVQCGGVVVHPGDIVFGDDDGIVVASPEEMAALIDKAEVVSRPSGNVELRALATHPPPPSPSKGGGSGRGPRPARHAPWDESHRAEQLSRALRQSAARRALGSWAAARRRLFHRHRNNVVAAASENFQLAAAFDHHRHLHQSAIWLISAETIAAIFTRVLGAVWVGVAVGIVVAVQLLVAFRGTGAGAIGR